MIKMAEIHFSRATYFSFDSVLSFYNEHQLFDFPISHAKLIFYLRNNSVKYFHLSDKKFFEADQRDPSTRLQD